jgi:hypothetical protein
MGTYRPDSSSKEGINHADENKAAGLETSRKETK